MALDFYFDYRSPYSFLALAQLRSAGVPINYHPFDVRQLMELVGNVPTTVLCRPKGAYAMKDIARWSQRVGVSVVRNPDMGKADAAFMLRATIAAMPLGPVGKAVWALYEAMWSTGANISSHEAILDIMTAAGVDPAIRTIMAGEDAAVGDLDIATKGAALRGVFGSPTFFVGEEMYFGNDRLDFVLEALEAAA